MNMRDIIDLVEASSKAPEGFITLYRGDASDIEKFETGKGDLFALFGRGIYLTNSKRVAGDYKTKGPAEKGDVIFRTSGKTRQDVIDRYVRQRARYIDADGHDHYGAFAASPVPYSDGGDFGAVTNDLRKAELEKRMEFAREIVAKLLKTYEVRIKLDGSAVIQKKAAVAGAKLSVFHVPLAYANKTLHADAEISVDVLSTLNARLQRAGDRQTASDMMAFARQYQREEGELPTFRQIFTSITADSPLLHNEAEQAALQADLMASGYHGIEYSGGLSMGGGHGHRAFVFWDADAINSFRVGATKA
jgi:hypothetical protein